MLAAVLLAAPLPYYVAAPCRLRILDARSVYVTEPGRIAADGLAVSYGTTVTAGQTLAVLQSHTVDLAYQNLLLNC